MKEYLINAECSMKPYNRGKWWIDRNIIKETTIAAESIADAINAFRKIAEDNSIYISNNAIKQKSPMYCDVPGEEEPRQCGYVLTGKTKFYDDERFCFSTQYIEVWMEIKEVYIPTFI